MPCPWGYNYDLILSYTVSTIGSGAPSSLYTLQGNVSCAGQNTFFDLPNHPGTGVLTTNVYLWIGPDNGLMNNYLTYPSCYVVNPSNLLCNITWIQVEAKDIAWQNIVCGNYLPIQLASFKGAKTDEGIELTWKTETETNNDYFEVQRSRDGEHWTSIAKIKGAGNSTIPQSYSYIDTRAETGAMYYRLKQVDLNLRFEYSPIIYVLNSPSGFLVSHIKPNPTANDIFFQIKTPVSGAANYTFINDAGVAIKSGKFEYHQGVSDVTLSLDELKPGFYLLEIDFENKAEKIFKKVAKL